MKLTREHLMAGTGCTEALAGTFLQFLEHACMVYSINTPKRLAAFLAQIGHESGGLRYVKEIWGPTPAQKKYEGRKDLGNTVKGDGKRFLGRGLIQITGRHNYTAVRDGLRKLMYEVPDFIEYPEELESLAFASLSAGWYWDSRNLNALADKGMFEAITRKINGGLNGYKERLALYNNGLKALVFQHKQM